MIRKPRTPSQPEVVRHLAAFVLLAAFLLSASLAFGQEASADFRLSVGGTADEDVASDDEGEREGYSPDHPLSVGLRSGAWIQSQVEPGVGGFLRFRPFSWLAGEVSTDHYFALDGRRRDHLVGLDLQLPFLGDERFSIGPTAGGSLVVRVSDATLPSDATIYQLLVGGRAGLQGELFLVDRVAAFVSAQAGLFVGENAQVLVTENEIAVSGSVFLEPVALLGAGASYAF